MTAVPLRRVLTVIVLLILLRWWLGMQLSLSVPAWEAYDEPGHFAYAVELSSGIVPNEPNPERIQPPLYYRILAFALWISGSDLTSNNFPERNPFFYSEGGVNYALHRAAPSLETITTERALRFSRLLSLLLTLPVVCFAYQAARRGRFPLLVAASVALFPQGLFNSSMVSNDGLVLMWGPLLTWLLIGSTTRRWWRGLLILLLIAVGGFIKLNLLLMLFPFAITIFLHRRRPLLWLVLIGVLAAITILLLSAIPGVLLPYLHANGGIATAVETAWSNLTSESGVPLISEGFGYLLYSSFGLFGWGTVALPNWLQAVSLAILLIGLAAGIVRRQLPLMDRGLLISIGVAPILGALVLTLYYYNIHLMTGRYLLPALTALCILLVNGWGRRIGWLLLIGLLILDLLLPTYIEGFYQRPSAVNLSAERAAIALLSGAELVDYVVDTEFPVVTARLCWRANQPISQDYVVRVEIIGSDGGGYGLLDTIPGNGNHPTTNWIVGETFCDLYSLRIRSDAPDGAGYLRVTMLTASYSDQASVNLEDAVVNVVHP